MSADRTVVFYGIRFDIESEELDKLDQVGGDPRIEAAEKAKLDVYYANFGGMGERYLLFIGKKIGTFGIEDEQERVIVPDELKAIFTATENKLTKAGINGLPSFYVEWQQDV